jgi:hypothetical protein
MNVIAPVPAAKAIWIPFRLTPRDLPIGPLTMYVALSYAIELSNNLADSPLASQ